jgi:diguanylate cyclase (GGDEF)-like protein/PAS domain S-box-containing protein
MSRSRSVESRFRIALIAPSPDPALAELLKSDELGTFEFVPGVFPAATGAHAKLEADAVLLVIDAVLLPIEKNSSESKLAIAAIKRMHPDLPIVVLTPTMEAYFDLAETGADTSGYVLTSGLTAGVLARSLSLAIERACAEALRTSEERYKRFYENSAAALYELDVEGNLISANPAMVKLFGYSSEADLIEGFAGHAHVLDSARDKEWFDLLRREKEVVNYRKSVVTREGRTLELLDTTRLVHDSTGKPVGYQGSLTDFTEVHQLNERLAYETNHDSLTSLPNRRAFEYQLQQAIDESSANGCVHALCYLDLDQFKVVNDTFGHAAGDQLLRHLSDTLASRLSSYDTLARVGGDEFALLLRNRAIEDSAVIANELLEAIRAFRLRWGDRHIDVGASIGVVPVDENTASLSDLLCAADTACSAAKEKGRNRVHVQEPDDKTVNRRISEMRLVVEAKHALQEDRMRLYHQPIRALPLSAEDQIRFEILIRMLGWDGQIISPGLFLPAIEKYNLSKTVDCWVVERFLAWMADTPKAVAKLAYGSINVSGMSLGDPDFLTQICARLDAHEISGDRICFEITETAAIQNLTAAQNFIATLKTRGCRFALDDFGSGTSSFGYLKNLPVDIVKIDGMFVRTLRQNQTDRVIVKSINDVAHSMGLATTAEFVEDADTLTIVTELGVDFAQGFAVGMPKPLPVRDVPGVAAKQPAAR